ncbi:MAG: serine/threonine-protein kinase [Phycisphaerales bacterium]|nr:serine/threonine-protein kinase [Phycisphaerales bacterium]
MPEPNDHTRPSDPNGAGGGSDATSGGSASSEQERRLIEEALRQLTPGSGLVDPPEFLPPAGSFPGYHVLRKIHEGGQGAVYQAVQLSTKRKVAIKLLHRGPHASSRDIARFEREVDILSQLDHPNIVAVVDAGKTADGSFFYVMDYIPGDSLDRIISRGAMPIEQAIQTFLKVCDAMSAAHLRGVTHRDLKPANIRVDAQGEPHVVDFGLAKAIGDSSVAGGGAMTVSGQFLGSLPWASPEQAEGRPDMIDPRSDVYSLGVVLYQMLTGKFPYPVIGNMRDVLDNILRAEPARPSTVRRKINDEVETIVLKCLSKERERRYQSAGELGRDLRRYLEGLPIEAKRDSGVYMLRKLVRRHRASAVVVGTIAAMVVTVAIVMTIAARREAHLRHEAVMQRDEANAAREDAEAAQLEARTQRDEAERARAEAIAARDAEAKARGDAEAEADRATTVISFFQELLAAARPDRAQGRDVTVREVLERASDSAPERLADKPLTLSFLDETIGRAYIALGSWDDALSHLRRALELRAQALGANDRLTLRAANSLAVELRNAGHLGEAASMLEKLDADTLAAYGPDNHNPYIVRTNLARALQLTSQRARVLPLFDEAIEGLARTRGEGHLLTREVRLHRAAFLSEVGRPREALPLLDALLAELDADEKMNDSTTEGRARLARAGALLMVGESEHASEEAQRAESVLAARLPAGHEDVLAAMGVRASALERMGRSGPALELRREVVRRSEDRPAFVRAAAALALANAHNPEPGTQEIDDALRAALSAVESATEVQARVQGALRVALARLALRSNDPRTAEAQASAGLTLIRSEQGAIHPAAVDARITLARAQHALNRTDDAIAGLDALIAEMDANESPDVLARARAALARAMIALARGPTPEARDGVREASGALAAILSPTDPEVVEANAALGEASPAGTP